MQNTLGDYYLWIRAIHIIAVISWMAGLLYLPRLFVYHTRVVPGGEQDQLFQLMERRLLRIIMNPAMILSWVFGLLLIILAESAADGAGQTALWLYVKLAAVVLLTALHMMMARWRRQFAEGKNSRSEKFYRVANEAPTLLMILIVIMVVVRPF